MRLKFRDPTRSPLASPTLTPTFSLAKRLSLGDPPFMTSTRFRFVTLALFAAWCCCGCMGPARYRRVQVSGKLTIDGKPPGTTATLALTPKDERLEFNPSGFVQSDGAYVLFSYGDKDNPDGIPPGKYEVRLQGDPDNFGMLPGAKRKEIEVTLETTTLDIDLEGIGKQMSPLSHDPDDPGKAPRRR